MLIMPDSPLWKFTIKDGDIHVCKCSKVPADALDEIRNLDKEYFECYGEHLVRFED